MYCHKCGKQLLPDADYCSYCGTKTPVQFEQSQNDSRCEAAEVRNSLPAMEESHAKDSIELTESEEKNNDDDNKTGTFLSKAVYIFITLLALAFLKVIARLVVQDQNALRVLSYAVPGFLFGVMMGIVAYIVLIKSIDMENKIWHIFVILGVSGVMGLIGGIPFAIGGSIISSVIIFIMRKK